MSLSGGFFAGGKTRFFNDMNQRGKIGLAVVKLNLRFFIGKIHACLLHE